MGYLAAKRIDPELAETDVYIDEQNIVSAFAEVQVPKEEQPEYISQVVIEANRILDEHITIIEAVAEVLVVERRMSRDRLWEILNRFAPSENAPSQ